MIQGIKDFIATAPAHRTRMLPRLLALACFTVLNGGTLGDWPTYGGDPGGSRYSSLSQISATGISRLKIAWTYHTSAHEGESPLNRIAAFEATPILYNNTLFLSTPFDQVIALDAATGKKRWKYDPKVDRTLSHSIVTSRGVAHWSDAASGQRHDACRERVFVGTIDARLIGLDARTGQPCADFGAAGVVDLTKDVNFQRTVEYKVTSAPTVIGNIVVVGTLVGDNQRVDAESGVVRGFDARSGRLVWSWD